MWRKKNGGLDSRREKGRGRGRGGKGKERRGETGFLPGRTLGTGQGRAGPGTAKQSDADADALEQQAIKLVSGREP